MVSKYELGYYGSLVSLFNVMVCVTAVSFAIFLNTKAGKKWKKNL